MTPSMRAVMDSARGRWFLGRIRTPQPHADTLRARRDRRLERDSAATVAAGLSQSLRIELLEMAKAIAETRADVAEIRPDRRKQRLRQAARPGGNPLAGCCGRRRAAPGRGLDHARARARSRDLRADRGAGVLDPVRVRAAQSERPPRAEARRGALQYLERRVNAMLEDVTTAQEQDGASAQAPSGTGPEAEEDQALQAESEDHAPPAANKGDTVRTAAGLGAAVGALSVGIGQAGIDARAQAHGEDDEATAHGAGELETGRPRRWPHPCRRAANRVGMISPSRSRARSLRSSCRPASCQTPTPGRRIRSSA